MPKFMLLIYSETKAWADVSEAENGQVYGEYFAYTGALVDAGVLAAGDPLVGVEAAKTVAKGSVTDGPFAETSPAVTLNRAVAVTEVEGPAPALAIVDPLCSTPEGAAQAASSHLLHADRADLLRRLGRPVAATAAYGRALALVGTEPERQFLQRRLTEVRDSPPA